MLRFARAASLVLALLMGGAANAANVVINNGLVPPNPDNVIDDSTFSADFVSVRNFGCGDTFPYPLFAYRGSFLELMQLVSVDDSTKIQRLIAGDAGLESGRRDGLELCRVRRVGCSRQHHYKGKTQHALRVPSRRDRG